MRGNVYLSIQASDFNDSVPFTFWDWQVTATDPQNPEAEPEVLTVHPTWAELAEKNKPLYGEFVSVTVGEDEYKLIELEASWLNGEMSQLIALGEGQSVYGYTLMNNSEAQAFVRENTSPYI